MLHLTYRVENKYLIFLPKNSFYSAGKSILEQARNNIYFWKGHKRMWSVTNYYLLNLTMADIMMATLNCIFSFIFMRDRYRASRKHDKPNLVTRDCRRCFHGSFFKNRFMTDSRRHPLNLNLRSSWIQCRFYCLK